MNAHLVRNVSLSSVLALAVLAAGCSTPASQEVTAPSPRPTPTVTVTETVEPEPAPTVTETVTAPPVIVTATPEPPVPDPATVRQFVRELFADDVYDGVNISESEIDTVVAQWFEFHEQGRAADDALKEWLRERYAANIARAEAQEQERARR